MIRRTALSIGVAIAVLGPLSSLTPASASPPTRPTGFTLNQFNDAPDAKLGNGKCDVDTSLTGNQCTLRAAVQEADYWGPGSNININSDSSIFLRSSSTRWIYSGKGTAQEGSDSSAKRTWSN